MIKIVIVLLFILNVFACDPVHQSANKRENYQQNNFACLASQSQCEISTEFGRFNIQFSGQVAQDRIKTELPFEIQLKFNATKQAYRLKSVISYLEGKDMFMGKIPVFFEPDEKQVNIMVAETLLASCSKEMMTWRLWLKVDIAIEGEVQQENFFIDFDSQRL